MVCTAGTILLNGQCLANCPLGYTQVNNSCVACSSNCNNCTNQTTCSFCSGSYRLNN